MLQAAHDRFVPIDEALDRVQIDLEELSSFVYVWGIDKAVSLAQFRTLSHEAKLTIFVQRLEELHNAGEAPTVALCSLITSVLKNIDSKLDFLIKLTTEKGVWLPLLLIKQKIVSDKKEIIFLTLRLAYDEEQRIDISDIEKLVFACPRKQKDELVDEHRKLDNLQSLIKAAKLIARHEVRCDIGDLIGRAKDRTKVVNMFRLIIKKGRAKYDGTEVVRWISILQDLITLQKTVFHEAIEFSEAKGIFIEEILNFGSPDFLALTRRLVCQSASQEEDLRVSNDGKLTSQEFINVELLAFEPTSEVVFKVAERFVLGATDLQDEYLRTALSVLEIIEVEEPGEVMTRHRRQVSILQLMSFFRDKLDSSMFGTDYEVQDQLTPVNIGRMVDGRPIELIDIYIRIGNIQVVELEQLTQLLATFNAEDLYPTSLIRSIDYQLDTDDVSAAVKLCHHLIQGNFKPTGWEQVKRAAGKVGDKAEQEKLLQYVLTHCSANQIEDVLVEIDTIRANRQQSVFARLSSISSQDEPEKLDLAKLDTYSKEDQQKLLASLMEDLLKNLKVPANFALATVCFELLENYDLSTSNDALQILFVCYMETLKVELNLDRPVLEQVIEIETPSREKLLDFIYGQDLVVYGIDVEQFFTNEEYRADSISGLADMEGDPEALSLAVELASRHGVDRFKILINHVETTINNFDFTQVSLEDVTIDLCLKINVLDEVKSDDRFSPRLAKYCWPQMVGNDHRRLKLYWTTLKLANEPDVVQMADANLQFLSGISGGGCRNVDFKKLLEAEEPSVLVDLLDSDLKVENVIKVDATLVEYKTHYEAFTMATEWLVRHLMELNNPKKLVEVAKSLPDDKQGIIFQACTDFKFQDVAASQLDLYIDLYQELQNLSTSMNENQIERKIDVFKLFSSTGHLSDFDTDRATWMRSIFDKSPQLKDMVYAQSKELEISEWFKFAENISRLVDFVSIDQYIGQLICNEGSLDEQMIDTIDLFYQSGEINKKLVDEITTRLTDKKTEVDVTLLSRLLNHYNIELDEYHLSAHVTRILLSIQYDDNFDDFKIAKKIHQLGQLSKLAKSLPQMIETVTLLKRACEFAQVEIDEGHRQKVITCITDFDKDTAIEILKELESSKDIVTVLRLSDEIGEMINSNLTTRIIEEKIIESFDNSQSLFNFIEGIQHENDVYSSIILSKIEQLVQTKQTIDGQVLKTIMADYEIEISTDLLVRSLEVYTPHLDKESLTKEGDFFKTMVKLAKERSSDSLK